VIYFFVKDVSYRYRYSVLDNISHFYDIWVAVDLQLHTFSTSTLDVREWSASRPRKRAPYTHQTGDSVSPRVCLDFLEGGKTSSLPTIESQSFYYRTRRLVTLPTGVSRLQKDNTICSVTVVQICRLSNCSAFAVLSISWHDSRRKIVFLLITYCWT
jgi:hypothetical protein